MATQRTAITQFLDSLSSAIRMGCAARDKAVAARMQAEQDAADYNELKALHRTEGLDRPYGSVTQDTVYSGMSVSKDAVASNRFHKENAQMYAAEATMWFGEADMWRKELEIEKARIARLATGR